MTLSTQPYKGARDFYPEDKRLQKYIFAKWREVAEKYGYEEYDVPLIEPLELYKAKTGDEIVNEQTYNFTDRGGRQVAIRPEMTPSVSRLVAARRQELAYPLRWYSVPNVWRYERPQKGRLREHWQLNVDIFGVNDLSAEQELVQIANDIMRAFGASQKDYIIKINSRKLLDWLLKDHLGLPERAAAKAVKILDKRAKLPADVYTQALNDATGRAAAAQIKKWTNYKGTADLPKTAPTGHLEVLIKKLRMAGVKAVVDITLARGFDYYTDIVFEIYDSNPKNSRSIFGGGRYDGLVELFGVEPVSAVGFGLGEVTLSDFLSAHRLLPTLRAETDLFAVLIGEVEEPAAKVLAQLRAGGLNVAAGISSQKADKQIKAAVKKGISYALFVGEQELKSQKYSLKNLKTAKESKHTLNEIIKMLGAK